MAEQEDTLRQPFTGLTIKPNGIGFDVRMEEDGRAGRVFYHLTYEHKGTLAGFGKFLSEVAVDLARVGWRMTSFKTIIPAQTSRMGLPADPSKDKEWFVHVEVSVVQASEIAAREAWFEAAVAEIARRHKKEPTK